MPARGRHDYIAFLRGINLGKRRPAMAELRRLFEKMKFTGVATFIASGNVIFSAPSDDRAALEAQIEAHLLKALGYPVDTFVRTRAEVAAAAAFQPFAKRDMSNPANTVHVAFVKQPMDDTQAARLLACRTKVDDFCAAGREFYWLCRIRTPDSKVWASPEMKAVKLATLSMRNVTTMRKLAALYPAGDLDAAAPA
jgi:uncharacterized protein (DUF1697 family)